MAEARDGQNKVYDNYEDDLIRYLENTQKLALLLDYDGTLTPMGAHPDLATIPPETKALLEDLSTRPDTLLGIISGRNSANVKQLVGIDNIVYAGNHGLEVVYPDGTKYTYQLPTEFHNQVKELTISLEKSVVRDGAWIESKGASLTLHFRATPEEKRAELQRTAGEIIEKAGFNVGRAHLAIEARPKIDWNKGSVALLILNREFGENNWQGKVKVVFVGDDTTDEDAMLALQGNAATFRIARRADKISHADKLLSSTKSVVNILNLIQKLLTT